MLTWKEIRSDELLQLAVCMYLNSSGSKINDWQPVGRCSIWSMQKRKVYDSSVGERVELIPFDYLPKKNECRCQEK